MNVIIEDTNKYLISCFDRLEELVLLKCSFYPKKSTASNVISIKIPRIFFTEIEKEILKFA